MVIAMHPDARLGERRAHQQRKGLVQDRGLRGTESQAQMPAEIPLAEQLQLAREVAASPVGVALPGGLREAAA